MASPDVVTKSSFAKLCGVGPSNVTKWLTAGILTGDAVVGSGREARIRVSAAQEQLRKRRTPGQALGNGRKTRTGRRLDDDEDDDALDYGREKARLARAQADAQELKNRQTRGELLEAQDVERRWALILSEVRSRMLAVPGRLRDELSAISAADMAKIDAQIRAALTDVSNAEFTE